MNKEKTNWVFFGGSEFSVYVLDELSLRGIKPDLIITTPDRPKGRKLILTPTPVKIWAKENNIEVIDPSSFKNPLIISGQETAVKEFLSKQNWDLFLVASYGKIIPKEIFEIPKYKTLNIHPSLLPKYRGASPIQSQILNDEKEVGVTVMQIDEKMDHGPIVVQKTSPLTPLLASGEGKHILSVENKHSSSFLPSSASRGRATQSEGDEVMGRKELEKILAAEGAKLFAQILPEWLEGKIKSEIQNEMEATYCEKIKKEDGQIEIDLDNLEKNARKNLLKIKAFEDWPTAYFFIERSGKKIRVIITDAKLKTDGSLEILKVIPEGKKEMPFEDFLRGQR